MVDGLIIMLIGMGVAFLFLIVLMGFIRLLGMGDSAPGQAASRPPGVGRAQTHSEGQVQEKIESPGDGAHRAAAVAVALELSRSGDGSHYPVAIGRAPSATWRQSGRVQLHQGPEIVAAIRSGRRGMR